MKTTMYAGAFLAVAVMVMTFSLLSEALFHSETPETFGYEIAAAEGGAPAAGDAGGEAEVAPIAPFLAEADAASGEKIFKKCTSCHNDTDGGDNKIGPNLWGVIGAVPGQHPGFKYSSSMVAFGEEHGPWDFESLNHFLLKPKDYIKGTAMGFAGLKKESDRADIIVYLNQKSSSPVPLPDPDAAVPDAAEAVEKPADGGTAPADDSASEEKTEKPADGDTAASGETMDKPAEGDDASSDTMEKTTDGDDVSTDTMEKPAEDEAPKTE